MTSFAHLALDFHDDPTILKDLKDIPKFVRETTLVKKAELQNSLENFALVIHSSEGVYPKFPTTSPGDTWLSLKAFEKTAHKLPLRMQETAAFYLDKAAKMWGLESSSSETFKKLASQEEISTNIVNANENFFVASVKLASKNHYEKLEKLSEEWFALPSQKKYPLHTPELIKKASDWFEQNHMALKPNLRKEFVDNFIKAATKHGVIIDTNVIFKYAGQNYSPDLNNAVRVRKEYILETRHKHLIDDLLEKKASLAPIEFAQVLEKLDEELNLDRYYGKSYPDAYESTFSMPKLADYSYTTGDDSISGAQLRKAVDSKEFREKLESYVAKEIIDEMTRSPVEVFESLPKPEKELIMSLIKEK